MSKKKKEKLKANICVKYEVENGEKTHEPEVKPRVEGMIKVVDFIANKNVFT